MPTTDKCPLKVFLCHIIPLWDAHADRDRVHALDGRVTPRVLGGAYRDHDRLTRDSVDAWLDKV